MKKKLLITLGCSFTQGQGCWDVESISNDYDDVFKRNELNFAKGGWPNRVGKKLGYDKVINLGLSASSNSTHLKLFVERILPMDLSNSDVLVIWMMTEPTRFSFYSGFKNEDFIPSRKREKRPLEEAYLKDIKKYEYSSLYEQIFYIKLIEQICENNNFNLLLTSWNDSFKNLYKIYPSNKYIHVEWVDIRPKKLNEYSPVCHHPNEKGYEYIANKLVMGIRENHSQYQFKPKQDIEWQWLGNVIQQNNKLI